MSEILSVASNDPLSVALFKLYVEIKKANEEVSNEMTPLFVDEIEAIDHLLNPDLIDQVNQAISFQPVLFQWRRRSTLYPKNEGWTKWEDCSEEMYNDIAKLIIPFVIPRESQYEVRKLFVEVVNKEELNGILSDFTRSAPDAIKK